MNYNMIKLDRLITQEHLTEAYEQKVIALIRLKYSQDQENAILRKKLANIDFNNEFDVYNSYVEACKTQVKNEINEINEMKGDL